MIEGFDVINYMAVNGETFKAEFDNKGRIRLLGQHEVGDIAYWNGGNIDFTPYSSWSSSLGTAIGVCFIPTSHGSVWDNGRARFLAVTGVNEDGSHATPDQRMKWNSNGRGTSLTRYKKVPTWSNTIGGSVGSDYYGYISSDRFTITQNVIDRSSYYTSITPYVLSPYAADGSFYEDYRRVISNNNALSDFKGKANTTTIVTELGTNGGEAAKACSLYQTSGTDKGDWYLPAMGELAYIMPRFNIIQAALSACGGVPLDDYDNYWSSTVYDSEYGWSVYTASGALYNDNSMEDEDFCVRPVVAL